MRALTIHRSNDLVALGDALGETIMRRPIDPLLPETIVVGSALHAAWLTQRLADRLGSWVNPSFPFLQSFVDELAARVLGDANDEIAAHRFDRAQLRWWIAARLPTLLDGAPFAELARYLADADDGMRLVGLAGRLAELFDRYAVYRPAWALSRAEDRDWQRHLWLELERVIGPHHAAARTRAIVGRLGKAPLPERVSFFGVSHLPPLYLELVSELARHTEVHLYVLAPTAEFLGDLRRSDRELPLVLATSGRRAREMQSLIESRTTYTDAPGDRFVVPSGATLLAAMQADILRARRRSDEDKLRPVAADRSFEVHVCHSALREVEVATDQLRQAFVELASLRPSEVAIATPDLPTYGPLLAAVLGEAELPFALTGTPLVGVPEIEAATHLLDLVGGPVGAGDVLALLESVPVRQRLQIEESDRPIVRRWFRSGPVRWGIDRAHRQRAGRIAVDQGTFRFAMDRWLAGYLTGTPTDGLDVAPLAPIGAGAGALLGRICQYLDELFEFVGRIDTARPLGDWLEAIERLLTRLVATPPERGGESEALGLLRARLTDEREAVRASGFVAPVGWRVAVEIAQALAENASRTAVQDRDAILIGDVAQLRALPHRVLVLLGFGDGALPRSEPRRPFDRIVDDPQLGDPSRRDDDRAALLEAVLAVRERLIVVYTGRDQHDDGERPPAVVVEELLDGADEAAAGTARTERVLHHPLHGYNRHYFDPAGDPRLRSFARAYADTALASGGQRPTPPPLFTQPLAPADAPWFSLSELALRLAHPVRALAERRLQLQLNDRDDEIDEREPLWLDGLQAYFVGSELLRQRLAGGAPEDAWTTLQRLGLLRPGTIGELELDRQRPAVERLLETMRRDLQRTAAPVDVQLALGAQRLQDKIVDHRHGGLHRFRIGDVRARDQLDLWLAHLALAASGHGTFASRYTATRSAVSFIPVEAARARSLLAVYADVAALALRQPLRLLARPGIAYAEARRDGHSIEDAHKAADAALELERRDGFMDLFFGRRPLWDTSVPLVESGGPEPRFEELAEMVYGPLVEHRR